MKIKLFIQLGRNLTKGNIRAAVDTKPILIPISTSSGAWSRSKKYLPTIQFPIEFELPDGIFEEEAAAIRLINLNAKDLFTHSSSMEELIAKAAIKQLKK